MGLQMRLLLYPHLSRSSRWGIKCDSPGATGVSARRCSAIPSDHPLTGDSTKLRVPGIVPVGASAAREERSNPVVAMPDHCQDRNPEQPGCSARLGSLHKPGHPWFGGPSAEGPGTWLRALRKRRDRIRRTREGSPWQPLNEHGLQVRTLGHARCGSGRSSPQPRALSFREARGTLLVACRDSRVARWLNPPQTGGDLG